MDNLHLKSLLVKNRIHIFQMLDPALAAGARAPEVVVLARDEAVAVRSEDIAEGGDFGIGGAFGEDGGDLGGGGIGRLAGGACGHWWGFWDGISREGGYLAMCVIGKGLN